MTLDRGLRVLELLAAAPSGLSVAEIAASLGLSRQAVYRALKTLIRHRFAAKGDGPTYHLGLGAVTLANLYSQTLQRSVTPFLRRLAVETDATAHIGIADGEEWVTLHTAEPPDTGTHLSYRIGSRHPLDRGAAGIAILSARPPSPGDDAVVAQARAQGYAVSRGQIIPGAVGIAAPLVVDGATLDASVGVVAVSEVDLAQCATLVTAAASEIARELWAAPRPW